jgi:NOL1/NOP2/fmu family ribosome biogenesis protein
VLTDPQEELYCIDKRYLNLLARLSHTTLRMTPGTPLGVLKGRDLIPAHALALSVEQSTAISGIEVERAAALAFLRKQELKDHLDTDRTGWQLIRYHGYGLGWVKVLPRRINNYLPKQYRIRMA